MAISRILLFLCLFASITSIAQTFQGRIIDSKTGEPIPFATIYFTGSSIGSTSKLDGTFLIEKDPSLETSLMFRIIGYESMVIKNPVPADVRLIQLKLNVGELDAVVLDSDPWSRKKKEEEFLTYFLGETRYRRKADVININKIYLRYNPVHKTLTARSQVPIVIEHPFLGYTIYYDLSDFTVNYKEIEITDKSYEGGKRKKLMPVYAYLNGSAYYKKMVFSENKQQRVDRRRKKLYESSELFLLQSMVESKLMENGFYLLQGKKKVNEDNHIRVRRTPQGYRLEFRENAYNIMDKNKNKSSIRISKPYIDVSPYFHLLTPEGITYGSFLGRLKTTGMLPLDYEPKK